MSRSATPPFLTLPPELVAFILSYLDCRSLLRCTSTCKMLKGILEAVAELQYIVELELDGMVDLGSGLPHSYLLKKLRERRKAWKELQWRKTAPITLDGDCWAYELVDGVFCKTGPGEFSIATLPTLSAKPSVTRFTGFDIQAVRDFAMDPTQDLIIFVQDEPIFAPTTKLNVTLHLRSLSKKVAHPQARQTQLKFTLPLDPLGNPTIRSVVIQIAEDTIAICAWTTIGSRLLAWNWRDASMLFDQHIPSASPQNNDFTLISPKAYIMTSTVGSGSIDVFSFQSPNVGPPKRVARMLLPELNSRSINPRSVMIHSGPICGRIPSSRLFASSPRLHMHMLQISYFDAISGSPARSFRLYMRNNTFLNLAENAALYNGQDIQWKDWGPAKTRFFPAMNADSYNWMRYVHGQRVIAPARGDTLHILDFSLSMLCDEDQCGVQTRPNHTPMGNLFRRDIVTSLPYRAVTRCGAVDNDFTGFMIDDERIIGLKQSSPFMDTVYLHMFLLDA